MRLFAAAKVQRVFVSALAVGRFKISMRPRNGRGRGSDEPSSRPFQSRLSAVIRLPECQHVEPKSPDLEPVPTRKTESVGSPRNGCQDRLLGLGAIETPTSSLKPIRA